MSKEAISSSSASPRKGRFDRFPALVSEVVARTPDVIVSNSNEFIKAFMVATMIPIVAISGDPIAAD